jgi:hypothetical protein
MTVILVLIFISNFGNVVLSNKENNVPDEFFTERYVIRRINVSGKWNPLKRNDIQRIVQTKVFYTKNIS